MMAASARASGPVRRWTARPASWHSASRVFETPAEPEFPRISLIDLYAQNLTRTYSRRISRLPVGCRAGWTCPIGGTGPRSQELQTEHGKDQSLRFGDGETASGVGVRPGAPKQHDGSPEERRYDGRAREQPETHGRHQGVGDLGPGVSHHSVVRPDYRQRLQLPGSGVRDGRHGIAGEHRVLRQEQGGNRSYYEELEGPGQEVSGVAASGPVPRWTAP